ncbi:MAG: hypothetical protein A2151_06795 [Candidatus Muproteobacteria bacterium RBG_16_65_34]|uniref:Plasmid pRiA4b Orf3-like domain-containing protein n=1 Tax=Candidatus Muproteobacteria bacterium RBG_16_65_34 TaxID=1817760 RepID=A0A1F6TVE4_9PROT|nr:MAG: hypothetical protein A2151_06795 [Candidatus Muproteobacteria bacterium RBG_16_65_34]
MNIYQIKVTLRHVHPPAWRRLQIPADIKLGKLHEVLQIAMGWTDSHMHAFRLGMEQYGVPSREFPDMFKNERTARLDQLIGKGDKLIYEYDFGDGWEHEMKIEKVLAAEEGKRHPTCLAGKRACPPEDCGGPWGYVRLLAVLRDPKHEEHEEMAEWIGEDFDPEAFDLDAVNRQLKRLK